MRAEQHLSAIQANLKDHSLNRLVGDQARIAHLPSSSALAPEFESSIVMDDRTRRKMMSMSGGVDGSFPGAHFDSMTAEAPFLSNTSHLSAKLASIVCSTGAGALLTRDFIGLFVTEDSQCRSCTVCLILARVGLLVGLSPKEPFPAWDGRLRGICVCVCVLSHRCGTVFLL